MKDYRGEDHRSRGSRGKRTPAGRALVFGLIAGALASVLCAVVYSRVADAQEKIARVKIYRVETLLYPFVQVYFRTQDEDRKPLENLNELNVALMVAGKPYDPLKRQYAVKKLQYRDDALRTVIVLSATKAMAPAFESVKEAVAGYIDSLRPQDETAILTFGKAEEPGYETVSDFTGDKSALGHRLKGIDADGTTSRLYDAVGAAMQMCASGSAVKGASGSTQAKYIASCSIIVVADGYDAGDAVSRGQLMTRISTLPIPLPIFSLGCPTQKKELTNLQGLSDNSFGKYYEIDEKYKELPKSFDGIKSIIQGDFVLVFRSYIPVDGGEHAIRLGIEAPSGSGNFIDDGAKFEADDFSAADAVKKQISQISESIKALPDKNPYAGAGGATGGEKPSGGTWWPFPKKN